VQIFGLMCETSSDVVGSTPAGGKSPDEKLELIKHNLDPSVSFKQN